VGTHYGTLAGSNTIAASTANIATMNVDYLTVNSAVVYGASTLNVYGTSNLTNVTVTAALSASTITATSANVSTFTVSGNTSVVGNVTVTSDASSNNYVLARRVPAGSLDVTQYVTGAVPLTTTTNLIQNYLSNAATITSNTGTGTITQALRLPGTSNSGVNFGTSHSVNLSNLATSNLFIEAWVNLSQLGVAQIILSRQNPTTADFGLYLTSGNLLTFYVINTGGTQFTASNASAIVAGTWYHVAASYQRTALTTGTLRVFVNGGVGGTTGSLTTTQPRLTSTANTNIGTDFLTANLYGNVADVRVFSGSLIVPTATFTTNTAPFTQSAPSYATGMSAVGTANTVLALQSQYFPGASTSPYGPCLTLPGTVGSYYAAANSAYDTNWRTSGFCLEMWINYASFANATNGGTAQSSPLTWSHGPGGGTYDWGFGITNVGGACLFLGGPSVANTAASVITTGSWNHIMVQGNGSNVYMAINGTFQPLNATYSPAGGNNTIAPTQPSVLSITSLNPIYVGSALTLTPPNFAIAKARLTFGTAGTPTLGNVYSTGNFTPNPNFAAVPVGAVVAWSLESQYPLPTYPSIQDVTVVPSQLTSYGAVPTPVGGVTSNVLSPYPTTYPQFDSVRFDGTGYIDYGNAASSSLTTNIWASNWTIEAWVYPTAVSGSPTIIQRTAVSTYTYDWSFWINGSNQISFVSTPSLGGAGTYNNGSVSYPVNLNTWSHVAATSDGTSSNVYVNGFLANTMPISAMGKGFNPQIATQIGTGGYGAVFNFFGNLADLRVSNVARYSGTTYVVPSAPFATDSSTLLLLKSMAGQTGTTLQVQGRGLNAVSMGATRAVNAYPPAPMRSYLLDTTSNALVTYGQGKYVASASTDFAAGSQFAWNAFTKNASGSNANGSWVPPEFYGGGAYQGSTTTVDSLGNSYPGAWLQVQMPVSIILSSYQLATDSGNQLRAWVILGSRDGINWTLVDSQPLTTAWTNFVHRTFTPTTTQAYNYFRMVASNSSGNNLVLYTFVLNGTEESLCVTNDSKVGVGIANPQRSLEVAGDLVVGGTISGGAGMGSFRNRIINGDMRIAQRGTSNVISTGAGAQYYMIDRFAFNSNFSAPGQLTQTQQTLTAADTPYQAGFRYSWRITTNTALTAASYGYTEPQQNIEGYNIADLMWGTSFGSPITVSFWFRTNLAPGLVVSATIRGGAQYAFPFAVTGNGTWQYVTATVPPPPNGGTWNSGTSTGISLFLGARGLNSYQNAPNAWITVNYSGTSLDCNPYATAGNYIEFTGVQLERGTVATPFEFRPFATELDLCQRYYYQANSTSATVLGVGAAYSFFGVGEVDTTSTARIYIQYPVPMRYPVQTFSSSSVINFSVLAGTNAGATSISLANDSTTLIGGRLDVGGTFTVGQGCILRSNALTSGATCFLGFSAEL